METNRAHSLLVGRHVTVIFLLNVSARQSYHPGERVQGGREVTVHLDSTHLRLNISLHRTAQHVVLCKMAVWRQCAR